MSRRIVGVALLLGAAGFGSACAPAVVGSPFGTENPSDGGIVVLLLENRTRERVEVTLTGSGVRIELGAIPGGRTDGLTLNWPRSGDLRARLEIVGGGDYNTLPILVSTGDHLHLVITRDLTRSFLRKR